MENIFKLLHMAFNVVIFFLAITLLYNMYNGVDRLVNRLAESGTDDNMLYRATPMDADHYTTKAELMSLLMEKLEYDIEVIDASGIYSITALGYSPSDIGLYVFTSSNFDKSYVYKINGTISKIIYRYVA